MTIATLRPEELAEIRKEAADMEAKAYFMGLRAQEMRRIAAEQLDGLLFLSRTRSARRRGEASLPDGYRAGLRRRLVNRPAPDARATAPPIARPMMLLETQARQALQHAVTIGACSTVRLTSGRVRVEALSSTFRV